MRSLRCLIVLVGFLPVACSRSACNVPAKPTWDMRQTIPGELLKEANRGRAVLQPDGFFSFPPEIRRVWLDVGAHHMESTLPMRGQ